jgi:ATP synthase protein I
MPEVDRGEELSRPGERSGDARRSNAAKRQERELAAEVEKRSRRKLRARRHKANGVWFGLGMFGLVGWSVAIPVLIFLALGIWIDSRTSGPFSWTLMLLVLGVILGSVHAWFWITKERKEMEREREEENVNE